MSEDAKPVTQAEIDDAMACNCDLLSQRTYIRDVISRLAAERDRLYAALDPAVCRLQFPDGSVPGNAREAAEGWHKVAGEAIAERDRLRAELDEKPGAYPHEVAQKLFPKEVPN